jgi:hypothetical protein
LFFVFRCSVPEDQLSKQSPVSLKNGENSGRITENEKQFKEEEAKDLIDLLKLEFCNPQ